MQVSVLELAHGVGSPWFTKNNGTLDVQAIGLFRHTHLELQGVEEEVADDVRLAREHECEGGGDEIPDEYLR